MNKRAWALTASNDLQNGRVATVKPTGHSMRGRINEGDSVVLRPCHSSELAAGDVVLARVRGRRRFHLVLHLIVARDEESFLIGNNFGRFDGWITRENIFGKATEIYPHQAASSL